ncbi:MAG: transposase [Bacteroidetes Order II. Incertae sedis bacterium]|nr:transposase [Bacteroidetes Order II. bacterium]
MKKQQQVSPVGANWLRRKYDRAFKQEAVRMLQSGKVVKEVAELLGVSEQVLYNWKSTVRRCGKRTNGRHCVAASWSTAAAMAVAGLHQN